MDTHKQPNKNRTFIYYITTTYKHHRVYQTGRILHKESHHIPSLSHFQKGKLELEIHKTSQSNKTTATVAASAVLQLLLLLRITLLQISYLWFHLQGCQLKLFQDTSST